MGFEFFMIWLQALFLISSSYYSHSPWFQRTGVAFAGAHRHNTFIQHNLWNTNYVPGVAFRAVNAKAKKHLSDL